MAAGTRVPSPAWLLWPLTAFCFVLAEWAGLASSRVAILFAQGDAPPPSLPPGLGTGATIVGGGATVALIGNAVAPLIGKWLENRHDATLRRIEADKAKHDEQREEYEREVASVLREFRQSLDAYAKWMHGFYAASLAILEKPVDQRSSGDLPIPPPDPAPEAPPGEFTPRLPDSVWAKSLQAPAESPASPSRESPL